jgi:nitroreductase
MMELLRKRRSIRKYQKKPVDRFARKILEEALLRSPSSRDIRPWRFVFVDDRAMLRLLSRCKENGSQFLADAALGIVICADETKSDVWVEDCAIASILVQMAALDAGLGSCWIQVRNRMAGPKVASEEHIKKALGLAANIRVESIISLGYPAEDKKAVPLQGLDSAKIIRYEPPVARQVRSNPAVEKVVHVKDINRVLKQRRQERRGGR